MIRIISFRTDRAELSEAANAIRTEVFVKEQEVPHELEYDGADDEAVHYLLYYNENPVATARWRQTETGVKLERFAVLKAYRNQNLGGELLKRVIEDTKFMGRQIYMHSQLSAVRFYERHGFVREGEMFEEAGIQHYFMRYNP
jgi:predicted GNAT family N-acyltransferase